MFLLHRRQAAPRRTARALHAKKVSRSEWIGTETRGKGRVLAQQSIPRHAAGVPRLMCHMAEQHGGRRPRHALLKALLKGWLEGLAAVADESGWPLRILEDREKQGICTDSLEKFIDFLCRGKHSDGEMCILRQGQRARLQ